METIQTFTLIDGVFKAQDARYLVMSFYNEKIKFHHRELLAMKLNNDSNMSASEGKIIQLQLARDQFKLFLDSLPATETHIELRGSIDVRVF